MSTEAIILASIGLALGAVLVGAIICLVAEFTQPQGPRPLSRLERVVRAAEGLYHTFPQVPLADVPDYVGPAITRARAYFVGVIRANTPQVEADEVAPPELVVPAVVVQPAPAAPAADITTVTITITTEGPAQVAVQAPDPNA